MLTVLTRLDDWTLDRLQVVVDWLQDWTGFGLTFWQRCVYLLNVCVWLTCILVRLRHGRSLDYSVCLLLFLVITRLVFGIYRIGPADAESTSALARNPRRIDPWIRTVRTLILVAAVLFSPSLFVASFEDKDFGLVLWLMLAIEAIDKRPVRPARIRELFRIPVLQERVAVRE
jgi:hypothetical protein